MEPSTWAFMTILILLNNVQPFSGAHADRVLLTAVKALTLHDDEMTKYRRTSPVPQLKCVGGSAAGAFKTVQCINRGSKGYDVQWVCKTDIDNSYRFGQVEVTCEGYDYPKDPYILRGSCGLEYTLEFTEEGWARKAAQGYKKYFSWNHYAQISNTSQRSFVNGLVLLLIIAVFTYIIYKNVLPRPVDHPTHRVIIPHHMTKLWRLGIMTMTTDNNLKQKTPKIPRVQHIAVLGLEQHQDLVVPQEGIIPRQQRQMTIPQRVQAPSQYKIVQKQQ